MIPRPCSENPTRKRHAFLTAFLASLAAAFLPACETAPPVREYTVHRHVAPVGERYYVTGPTVAFTRPLDRSYDIMNKNWERPWPFGPYGRGD